MNFAKKYFQRLQEGFNKIPLQEFEKITQVLLQAYDNNQQVFIMGNGGSAAIASHMACDLGKGTLTNVYDPREKRFRVISLTDNMPFFSALANDLGYEHVFTQQLQNLLKKGDVVIGISCSGNSPNIVNALAMSKENAAVTIGFIGFDGGKMKKFCDYFLHFEERNYQRCEDAFLIFQHAITSSISDRKRVKDFRKRSLKHHNFHESFHHR